MIEIKKVIFISLVIILLVAFFIFGNNAITLTRFFYTSPKVPKSFDGFKILHISDLHNKRFGDEQQALISVLKQTAPDAIFITGDLIDRRRFDLESSLIFIRRAVTIAPVYYVPGNHEAWSYRYDEIRKALLRAGVTLLEDQRVTLSRGEDSICIAGLMDPGFSSAGAVGPYRYQEMADLLSDWRREEGLTLLLSHRPELFPFYEKTGVDAVFCGHAHGGQIRLPFIGALYAPNQGLFPKYTAGEFGEHGTKMYVSRGLGNSLFPLRVFNRPEVVLVTLRAEEG